MTRPRLLVVEDTPLNRDLIEQILEDEYDLEFALDGPSALEKIQTQAFDAVLLDISIPKIDGLEVVRRVRKQERLRNLPMVAVTAHAMSGDRARMLEAGCDEHITKPIDETLLHATLRRLLQRD